jgi:hypothetical protein
MINGLRVLQSAANDVPSLLLGFSTNTRPAMFLVRQEIFGALDIGNDVSTSRLESFGAGNDSLLDVDRALHLQGFGAFGFVVEIVDGLDCDLLGNGFGGELFGSGLEVEDGESSHEDGQGSCQGFHGDI